MTKPMTILCPGAFQPPPPESSEKLPSGRVPRLTRLLALAMRLERLVREGTVAGYAELARLGQVSLARISQIIALVNFLRDEGHTVVEAEDADVARQRFAEARFDVVQEGHS